MDIASTKPYGNSEEGVCDYCGAKFKAIITRQSGHNEREDYNCPDCNKRYSARASLPIKVTLISPRTDGKTDKYNNQP